MGAAEKQAECIFCGKCLEVCPLLAATGREEFSPRAKAHLAQTLQRDPNLLNEPDAAALAGICLGCGQCAKVCSQGVDVPAAVARLRATHPGWKGWLWKRWMERAKSLWPLAGRASRFVPEAALPGQLSGLLKLAQGLGRDPIKPFVNIEYFPESYRRTEVLLFPGCAAQNAAPYWTSAAEGLCDSLGLSRIGAQFSCCGAGLATAGLPGERLEAARRNVEIWRAGGRPWLVIFCASCLDGLRAYAGDRDLLPDQEEADAWLAALTPLSRLLNSARFVVSPDAPQELGYHHPCHASGHDPDEALVRTMFVGRELQVSQECCGFGGIMQLGAPSLSKAVSDRCWSELAPKEGTLMLTGCTACVFQLAATSTGGTCAAHWLEAIATI